jgi:endonuclease/exonuclease/phosphatase family metal-dependent hydrolase
MTTPVRLLTWNVNHRVRERRIPPEMAPAIFALEPDVVVLTEFVDGPSRAPFYQALSDVGLRHRLCSASSGRHNRVMIASRTPIDPGNIVAPPIAPSVPSNVLHARVPALGLEVLGVRIPDFGRKPALRRACWDFLLENARAVSERPFVILGDLNTDPRYPRARCGDRIGMLVESGWRHAAPDSGGSYWTPNGNEVRIDHAFASQLVVVRNSSYVKELGDFRFAGKAAMSDHAALVVTVEV